jgi:hypothetical protein
VRGYLILEKDIYRWESQDKTEVYKYNVRDLADVGVNETQGKLFFVLKRQEESFEVSLMQTEHTQNSESIRRIGKWWKDISSLMRKNMSQEHRLKLYAHKIRFKRLQASERLTRLHRLMVGSTLTDDEFWNLNPPKQHHRRRVNQLTGLSNDMVSDIDPDNDIAFNPLADSRKLLFRVNRNMLTQILHEDPVTKHSFLSVASSSSSSNSSSSSSGLVGSSPSRSRNKSINSSSSQNQNCNNTSISIESLRNRKFWKTYFKKKFKPPVPAPPPRDQSRRLGTVYWLKRRLERIKRVSHVNPSVNIQRTAFDVDNTMFSPRWILPDTSSDSCGGRVTGNTYMLLHRPHSRLVRYHEARVETNRERENRKRLDDTLASLNHHSEIVTRSYIIAPGQAVFMSHPWVDPNENVDTTTTTTTTEHKRHLDFSDAHPARRAIKKTSGVAVIKEENGSPARKRQRTSFSSTNVEYKNVLPEVKHMAAQPMFSHLNAERVSEDNKIYHDDIFWNQLSDWTILIQEMLRIVMCENLPSEIDSDDLFEKLRSRLEIVKQEIERSTVKINKKIGRVDNLAHPPNEYKHLNVQIDSLEERLIG